MKKVNLILLKNLVRFYGLAVIFYFGATILLKHYLFQDEITNTVMADTFGLSLIMGVFFSIFFRFRWYKNDEEAS